MRLVALLVLSGCCLAFPTRALAAQGYDSCTGFIDSVPTTITTQGTWCLRKDLSTSITSGPAIQVATNNVTLDCNDFKIGGLAAGNGSSAAGIHASDRQNITVRNCNVRGFSRGLDLRGGAGHLVENNRLDNNLTIGIYSADTSNTVVSNNHVFDTGGHLSASRRYGIFSVGGDAVQITDNFISGLVGTAGYNVDQMAGIYRMNTGGAGGGFQTVRITDNFISGLESGTAASVSGFLFTISGSIVGRVIFAGNELALGASAADAAGTRGIACHYPGNVAIRDNVVWGFESAWSNCIDDGGNVSH